MVMSGIIPARAGFTATSSFRPPSPPDHPRSRGVYGPVALVVEFVLGSSPLARGLPPSLGERVDSWGIIPARAGFTRQSSETASRGGDHPRSRGVYVSHEDMTMNEKGSSPLARGLPKHFHPWGRVPRIIPARAGFTHPLRPAADNVSGSSPLARGLHQAGHDHPPRPGIIPARAGFTSLRRSRATCERDHPRSRGVYPGAVRGGDRGGGSSPLARGLLSGTLNLLQVQGIIPARAGFTRWCWGRRRRRPDHPRSRGVYDEYRQARGDGDGSSPLARGLRHLQDAPRDA